jgi:hypothetical protein
VSERCFFNHPLHDLELLVFGPVVIRGSLRFRPLCITHTSPSFLADCSITICAECKRQFARPRWREPPRFLCSAACAKRRYLRRLKARRQQAGAPTPGGSSHVVRA